MSNRVQSKSKRSAIRQELVKRLRYRTSAGVNVRANRGQPNWQENLPAINIYFRGEQIEVSSQAPNLLKRIMSVEIECIDDGRDGDQLSDKLDAMIFDIETTLGVDNTLGDTVNDINLAGISDMEAVGEGSKTTMAVKVQYQLEYYEYVPATQDGQGVNELDEVDATWTLENGNQTDVDKAKDKITM